MKTVITINQVPAVPVPERIHLAVKVVIRKV